MRLIQIWVVSHLSYDVVEKHVLNSPDNGGMSRKVCKMLFVL